MYYMIYYLYNLFWTNQNKISPKNSILSNTYISNLLESKDLSDKKYYALQKNIRNFEPLTKRELLYLRSLNIENLIEIIEIYNQHSVNMKEYFKYE